MQARFQELQGQSGTGAGEKKRVEVDVELVKWGDLDVGKDDRVILYLGVKT